MPNDSRFTRLIEHELDAVTVYFEDQPLSARRGDSVAGAVLAAGHWVLRTTPVSGARRGPFCMMGVCFECLMEIDGEPNRQACMVPVSDGLRIRRMHGARSVDRHDVDD